MKRPMNQIIGITAPPDGFTQEEKSVVRLLGETAVEEMYARMPTSRMKAIVALYFELGYTQELIARMFGVKQEMIHWEIDMVRKVLTGSADRSKTGKKYQPRRPKSERSVSHIDLLKLAYTLSRQ